MAAWCGEEAGGAADLDGFEAGRPVPLFRGVPNPPVPHIYSASSDGERFLFPEIACGGGVIPGCRGARSLS